MKMTTAIYEASKLGYNLELQETEHPEMEFYGQHFGFHNNLETAFNELIERAKQGAPS